MTDEIIAKLLATMPDCIDSLKRESDGGNCQASKTLLDYSFSYTGMAEAATVEDQADMILALALSGKLSATQADKLMTLVERKANIVELSKLTAKLEALENK